MNILLSAASKFANIYNANAKLISDQNGWNCLISLFASDNGEKVNVEIRNGQITDITEKEINTSVVVTSESKILYDILELRLSPNEPYLFGDLTVRGPEADFLRLDYAVTVLCPY